MSSEEESAQRQQDTLQQTAARIIQKNWREYMNREVFKYFKELISRCNQGDPQAMLRAVNPREAKLLDAAAGVFIRFRLGGITFPPSIYYKIFTYRPITDLCASSPRDYTQPGLKEPVAQQDRSGWYQRKENNSWRLFCRKVLPMNEPKEIGANKKMEFHFSKLQRQRDVSVWHRKRKIKWLKNMYNQGRQQELDQHNVVTMQVMDAIEEKGHDEMLNREVDELLAWTNTLDFERYMQEWMCLACSHPSERIHDVHSYPPGFDPR
ncbi:protein MFI isoform X2 [Clinocottus analis]|uniref:protein MFI isoform X2 n=1 Tax=Clinocottus analis TaxID=304258 RepID=UPI0035BF6D70